MALKNKTTVNPFRAVALRITRTNFYFVALYFISIILFDSGNVITRGAVAQRWIAGSVLLIIMIGSWYLLKIKVTDRIQVLLACIILSQIVFTGFQIYWERGMAATSTILLIFPLITAASTYKRTTILTTAVLSAMCYSLASVKYFNDFFNEGYRMQLWASIVFYSGLCFVAAWLLMNLVGLRHDSE